MGEKRLMEITSTINILDGPMLVVSYIMSLNESDIYLFLKYVKSSKYSGLNFYEAVKLFSSDYLMEKSVMEENNPELDELGYSGVVHDMESYYKSSSDDYFSEWNSISSYEETKSVSRRK